MIRRRELFGWAAASVLLPITRLTAADSPWRTAASIPIQTQEIYCTVHQERLYVAGGIAAKLGVPYFSDEVFAYEADKDRWLQLADLPEALHHVALVSDGARLLATGGFNGGYTHIWRMRDSVYQLEEGSWQLHSNLPGPQAEGVVTQHAGNIHIATGQQPIGNANSKRSDHAESPLHWVWSGDSWESLAPVPTPRNSATGGWIGDIMLVVGGRTATGNLATTEIYDSREDRWRSATPMPSPQAGAASVIVDNELYVFGGEIFHPKAAVFPNVWRYQLDGDRWEAMPNLPTPRHGLGAGLLGNNIHVVGGATKPGGRGTSDIHEVLKLSELS